MKRKIAKYTLATALTGLIAASVGNAYTKIGQETETVDLDKVKKVAISGSLFAGIVWAVAIL